LTRSSARIAELEYPVQLTTHSHTAAQDEEEQVHTGGDGVVEQQTASAHLRQQVPASDRRVRRDALVTNQAHTQTQIQLSAEDPVDRVDEPYGNETAEESDDDMPGVRVGPQGVRPLSDFLGAVVFAGEPSTYHEAVTGPDARHWLQAVQAEHDALVHNGTWEISDLPPRVNPLKTKWVFKLKLKADGSVDRYKARLVAKGFQQRYGINYTDVFAPVAKLTTIRVLLATATSLDWELEQMDVVTAFLHGKLDEDVIFIEQPEGLVVQGQEHKVLRLRKALYGLKQAPRLWNKELDTHLRSLGFVSCESDHALYVLHEGSHLVMIIAVYVDDLLLACKDCDRMTQVKRELSAKFSMKDLGAVTYYLGMEIVRDRGSKLTYLHQERYVRMVAEKFFLLNSRPVSVPMQPGVVLSRHMTVETAQEQTDMARVPCSSAVGAVLCSMPLCALGRTWLMPLAFSAGSVLVRGGSIGRPLKGSSDAASISSGRWCKGERYC